MREKRDIKWMSDATVIQKVGIGLPFSCRDETHFAITQELLTDVFWVILGREMPVEPWSSSVTDGDIIRFLNASKNDVPTGSRS